MSELVALVIKMLPILGYQCGVDPQLVCYIFSHETAAVVHVCRVSNKNLNLRELTLPLKDGRTITIHEAACKITSA